MCLHSPKPICAEQLLQSLDWPYLSHRLRAQKQGILLFILRASGTEQTLNQCLWDGCAKKGRQQASCCSASYRRICVIVPATSQALRFQLTSSLATIRFLGSFTVVFGAPDIYTASLQRRLPLATKRAAQPRAAQCTLKNHWAGQEKGREIRSRSVQGNNMLLTS